MLSTPACHVCPICGSRTPDSSKAQAAKGRGFLDSCKDALPGVAGSVIAIAALVLIGRTGSAPLNAANTPVHDSQEADAEVAPQQELLPILSIDMCLATCPPC